MRSKKVKISQGKGIKLMIVAIESSFTVEGFNGLEMKLT